MTMQWQSNGEPQFRIGLRAEFDDFLSQQARRFEPENCLQIDFHCHDHNSDVPDELWGRILRLPETWVKTKKLMEVLGQNGSSVVTVTNHNNARSCWALQDKGVDVLVGCEFTCFFPEYDLFIHVLTYGFTREQEVLLNEKRQNIYDFLRYAARYDIPVILPHPLYFYSRNERIDLCLFEKLAVMFWRFEVLNGQRDLWQSVLTLNWVQSLTPDRIRAYARKHKLDPSEFGVNPDKPKVVTGGSDDHTGIFAGLCGSQLYVPDLQQRLKTQPASHLALEALRNGQVAPFGNVGENQKLNIALLDYFAQAATKLKDPGLLRILLHRGSTWDKMGCFMVANLFLEMQKHKKTTVFFALIHDALQGKKPKRFLKWQASKDYAFCITQLDKIADSKRNHPEAFVDTVNQIIGELFNHLNHLIAKRVRKAVDKHQGPSLKDFSTEELTRKLEIPSQLTALFLGDGKRQDNMSNINLAEVLDSLSFPVLISTVLAGSTLASTRVLYQNRDLLNRFARQLGKNEHSRRALCLTDTLLDKNGVSTSLSGKLKEIKRTNLPLDFLICHSDAVPEPHLSVVRPIADIDLHPFGDQTLRVPDVMEIARIFYEGGYDRIVCSTEGPMALVALFLQQMFNVPCYFFMHTDWIDFIAHTTHLNQHERDRVRRLMRALYRRFDGVFVLNREHRDWLTGHEMQLPEDRVFLTAHHTAPRDLQVQPVRKSDLIPGANDKTPVLFIACRLSREKGIFDLPEIVQEARRSLPNLQIVVAGSGPASDDLQRAMPDAVFLGWQTREQLASLYLGLDLFVFPSRFDTFGNVLLEAFTHGMPAVAYNCKGPKDILEHGVSGYLTEDVNTMAEAVVDFFSASTDRNVMAENARKRAARFQAEPIMRKFLEDLGLDYPEQVHAEVTVA
ncbi:glycosyltransferase [Marinobacter sp. M3C]|uniref:glycosyltransferase n=1 Tax=unclassified Marinobacter TaxID=83889 RepID=UPI00200E197F|nr:MULTISPECIES: glycosyltransferase [unclassified Marinobacter]MCL1478937.1 glycosyltransferase [Marinobacter sp.]MCL1480628.1 glycosyltransferase [Marinobacter sp.]MCL1484190.1 glycosyltransferase [Marinobacter sp.]MCL1487532.1 glycosyltransferase [Marinobacter sp.]UQG57754.1 glycosyltransferase [Marinobacter sp. M4C]